MENNVEPNGMITNLKNEWNSKKDSKEYNERSKSAQEQKTNFDNWFEGKDFSDLTLDVYTNLKNNDKDGAKEDTYFTWWMERGTDKCGKFRTASSLAYGIYRMKGNNKDEEKYGARPKKGTKELQVFNTDIAKELFNQNIKRILGNLKAFGDTQTPIDEKNPEIKLEINYMRKIAYMFNPHKLIPIFQNATIKRIAKYLGINVDLSSYKATSVILDKLITEKFITRDNDLNVENAFATTQKLMAFLWGKFGMPFELNFKNIIFYGPPGTGKTYQIEEVKELLKLQGKEFGKFCEVVQFHPNYTYEDFIEGYKPASKDGKVEIIFRNGKFKDFCKKATKNLKEARENCTIPDDFYFFADEINRADLSRVLGEVLVCLEEDKRIDFDADGKVTGHVISTAMSTEDTEENAVLFENNQAKFGIPSNIFFIGTMNSIDRSIDAFDLALRRRFVWQLLECNYEIIKNDDGWIRNEVFVERCKTLNNLIETPWGLGKSFQIGHAYFMLKDGEKLTKANIEALFDLKLAPLLTEYLRAQFTEIEAANMVKKARNVFVNGNEPKVKGKDQNTDTSTNTDETNSETGDA